MLWTVVIIAKKSWKQALEMGDGAWAEIPAREQVGCLSLSEPFHGLTSGWCTRAERVVRWRHRRAESVWLLTGVLVVRV